MSRGKGGIGNRSYGQHRAAAASYRSSRSGGAARATAAWGARGAAAAYGRSGTKDSAAAGAYKTTLAHGGSKAQAKAAARGAAAAISQIQTPIYTSSSSAILTRRRAFEVRPLYSHQESRGPSTSGIRIHLETFAGSPYYVGANWRDQLIATVQDAQGEFPGALPRQLQPVQTQECKQKAGSSRKILFRHPLIAVALVLLIILAYSSALS